VSEARPAAVKQPVIFVVDDDPTARALTQRLLERRFGADYRIVAADDAESGLRRLAELAAAQAEVALVLADVSMAGMSGVEFLGRSADDHPTAERVVLVDWNELEPARDEIVRGAAGNLIDSYLLRPWRDVDEVFYHAVSKFLEDWDRDHRPQFEAIRVIGTADDAATRELCATLYRSGVAYGFYDVATDAGATLLAQCGPDATLPMALLHDGRRLAQPTPAQIAGALGVNVDPAGRVFDVVVVGSGPAGMAAAVYGSSEGLDTLVLEHEALGGQAASSSLIRNYLGFPRGLAGAELTARAFRQAWFFGTAFLIGRTVQALRTAEGDQLLKLDDGSEVRTRTTVLACGVSYRRLGIERLEALVGRGVYYGAPLTEAHGLAGKQVVVVGGGNSSAQAILYLARFAEHAVLVVRDPLIHEMSDYLEREIAANPRIEVRLNTTIADALGEQRLAGLVLRDNVTGRTEEVAAAAAFLLIGAEPRTDWLPSEIERDERGYIATGSATDPARRPAGHEPALLETTLPGVFAAGDVRLGSMKRIAAAVGEGSSVIRMCHQHLAQRAREAVG
jgi:thioredoxin reductase (NADPH)